jgi:hypothetical protein
MAVTNLLAQSCNKADNAIKLVTNLLQQTGNKQCEHNLLTACEQICDSLFADLLQLVRFHVCMPHSRTQSPPYTRLREHD